MIAASVLGVLAALVGWRLGLGHVVELAKEFGGGFVAYWTHHCFQKVWRSTSRGKH